MLLFKNLIKITFIKFFSFFCFEKKSKVIFYHDIHSNERYTDMSTSIELFKKHIQIIKENGYEIVSHITKKYGQIEICFDDAFLGIYDHIDFFKKKNIPIHLFVITSHLDKINYLNNKQLLELSKLDIVKISSHTHSHVALDQINDDKMERELRESKEIIENLLSISVDSICYPKGRFNHNVIRIAELVGYKYQYSSLPGYFDDKFMDHIIKRSLVQFATEKEFKAILIGGDHFWSFWYRLKHFKR